MELQPVTQRSRSDESFHPGHVPSYRIRNVGGTRATSAKYEVVRFLPVFQSRLNRSVLTALHGRYRKIPDPAVPRREQLVVFRGIP
jgi:hypothetical protein